MFVNKSSVRKYSKFWCNIRFGSKVYVRLAIVITIWLFLLALTKSLRFSNNFLRGTENNNTADNIGQRYKKVALHDLNHAIIVAGHAVVRPSKLGVATTDEDAWYLLSYQKGVGFPGIIASHIIEGGQTRHDVGPTSEALSYYLVAQQNNWIEGHNKRVYLEEYARDSFENLLFSLCRFYEITGNYPTAVTVIGFDFKSHRFSDLHRKAVSFPSENFTYIGLVPTHAAFDHKRAVEGESFVVEAFEEDMYGCYGDSLHHKRIIRNPFLRTIPYSLACPAMKSLLEWCGPEIYNGPVLPWEQRNRNSNINGNNKYRNQISNLDNIFQANFTPLAQQPIKNTN